MTRPGRALVAALVLAGSCARHGWHADPAADAGSRLPRAVAELAQLEVNGGSGGARLVELARSGVPAIRVRALLDLGRWWRASNAPVVQAALADADPLVRGAAAGAAMLARTQAAGLARPVEAALASEHDATAAAAEALALGAIGGEDAVAAVAAAAQAWPATRGATNVREAALRALGGLGGRGIDVGGARPAILDGMEDARAAVRVAAVYAAGALAETAPAAPIGDAIDVRLEQLARQDHDATVRAAAVRARARRAPTDVRFLAAAAEDGDWRVKTEAGMALAAAGSAGVARLAPLLGSEWQGIAASEDTLTGSELHVLLGWLRALWPAARDPTLVPVLGQILELSDVSDAAVAYRPPVLRGIALVNCDAAALATAGGRRGLVERCGGSDVAIEPWRRRVLLAQALTGSTDAAGRATLLRLAGRVDRRVVWAAQRALRGMAERVDALVEWPSSARSLADPRESAGELPDVDAAAKVIAEVVTEKGDFRVALDPRTAPRAVSAIVALARGGRLGGIPVDAAPPDYAVQLAGPSAVGGPPVRIEDERTPGMVERGTVGLLPDPQDTADADARLWIAERALPELDGRAPLVGHVTEGMAVVDRLEPGDRVVGVYVTVTPQGGRR